LINKDNFSGNTKWDEFMVN